MSVAAGNEWVRVLLVSGATSVINAAIKPGSRRMTDWLRALLLRKPRKLVAVALANKMARTSLGNDEERRYVLPLLHRGWGDSGMTDIRHVTIGSGTMPRLSVNEEPHDWRRATGTYCAAHAAGVPVVRTCRPMTGAPGFSGG